MLIHPVLRHTRIAWRVSHRHVFAILWLAAMLWLIAAPVSLWAALPVGEEFQVNVTTTGDQLSPDVAATSAGGFVVVWQSPVSPGTDTDGQTILGRRFDADGQPIGSEMQINSTTTYGQLNPRVASREDGSFVVQWRSVAMANKGLIGDLWARPFDSSGAPIRTDFQVVLPPNIYTEITDHDIAAHSEGRFVVATAEFYTLFNGSYTSTIETRQFFDAGLFIGSVNTHKSDSDKLTVSLNAGHPSASDFVIAWRGTAYNTQYNQAESARLGFDGAALTPVSAAHDALGVFSGINVDAAFNADGDWVVVWGGYDSYQQPSTADSTEIYGRRIASDGTPDAAGAAQVNSLTASFQNRPTLARGQDGNFLVVWNHPDPTNLLEVRGRLTDGTGAPVGLEFPVNAFQPGDQFAPRVAASLDRRQFLVVWTSATSPDGDTDGRSIRAQRFLACGIFVDGFESGGLERWDGSAP